MFVPLLLKERYPPFASVELKIALIADVVVNVAAPVDTFNVKPFIPVALSTKKRLLPLL